jgi:hypothetical protein
MMKLSWAMMMKRQPRSKNDYDGSGAGLAGPTVGLMQLSGGILRTCSNSRRTTASNVCSRSVRGFAPSGANVTQTSFLRSLRILSRIRDVLVPERTVSAIRSTFVICARVFITHSPPQSPFAKSFQSPARRPRTGGTLDPERPLPSGECARMPANDMARRNGDDTWRGGRRSWLVQSVRVGDRTPVKEFLHRIQAIVLSGHRQVFGFVHQPFFFGVLWVNRGVSLTRAQLSC